MAMFWNSPIIVETSFKDLTLDIQLYYIQSVMTLFPAAFNPLEAYLVLFIGLIL